MDRDQFVKAVESNQKAVRRFLTALCCGNIAMADDLAQDTFVKAYLSSGNLKDNSKFTSWIYRIAYNSFISHSRNFRPDGSITEAYALESAVHTDDAYEYQNLYIALDHLSDKERTTILLYYMQGYSTGEIAEITDSSTDAVKQLLSRGRQHLKYYLQNDYERR